MKALLFSDTKSYKMTCSSLIPDCFAEGARKAAKALAALDNVLIAAHVNMDGDALGSVVACGYILRTLGRRFALYAPDGVPDYLKFLPLPGPAYSSLAELPFEPETALYLDCSEAHRLGDELAGMASKWPSVNIDHHLTRHGLGSIANFIEPDAAATAQLIAYVTDALRLPLTGCLAQSIALGLITDTGGFCHGNTTAPVFALCGVLAANGCDFAALREKLENGWTHGHLRLWGEMLGRGRLENRGRVAICVVYQRDLKKYNCTREDLEGLVEWFRRVKGVDVAVLLREEAAGLCKFSLRSFGEINVREMAAELGGGGHRNAAGGTLRHEPEKAQARLLEVIAAHLEKSPNNVFVNKMR